VTTPADVNEPEAICLRLPALLTEHEDEHMTAICLHASASTPGQWRAWRDALASLGDVSTPALIGYGPDTTWGAGQQLALEAEVDALSGCFSAARSPVVLIGHSYGGAVALAAALRHRSQLQALVLYEPVLFGILTALAPADAATHEICQLRQRTTAAVARGDRVGAAAAFIAYWLGAGSWDVLPEARRALLAQAMPVVVAEWDAVFTDPTSLAAYRQLDVPVLYLLGARSPRPVHLVADLLGAVFPQVTMHIVEGVGHMGPVTDPDRILPAVLAFLDRGTVAAV
jgi:pimeloyl-ACP methyl ester carboxylesterase